MAIFNSYVKLPEARGYQISLFFRPLTLDPVDPLDPDRGSGGSSFRWLSLVMILFPFDSWTVAMTPTVFSGSEGNTKTCTVSWEAKDGEGWGAAKTPLVTYGWYMVYPIICRVLTIQRWVTYCQWIGFVGKFYWKTPTIFHGKNDGVRFRFSRKPIHWIFWGMAKKALMDVKIWESSHVWKMKVLNGFDSLTHVKTGTMMGMLAAIYSKNLQHGVLHGVLPKKLNLAAKHEIQHISTGHKTRNNQEMRHTPVKSISLHRPVFWMHLVLGSLGSRTTSRQPSRPSQHRQTNPTISHLLTVVFRLLLHVQPNLPGKVANNEMFGSIFVNLDSE